MWDFAEMSSDEVASLRARYEPLTQSIRELIDAALHVDADNQVVDQAKAQIDAAAELLRAHPASTRQGMALTPEGESIPWDNLGNGIRNPLAPPLVVEHTGPTSARIDVELGAAYEGPPGHVHGGYCALVLDQILGEVASRGSIETVAATGTISLRYLRPTKLGRLHVEAEIQRTEGRKIFITGHIADEDGTTVTAEGLFIVLRQ
ncbi:PaaI family thioesterase [Nocardioides humilatus]|uniref:Acyl-coenzyme A thioesterase THEM4 n=1 Tax=Nocardioides humilatus TaxID=2607660 RepID=A0A5B1LH06_9ACTN|nr:PaaI family thioesterase [Nocardioides humilatus]KAA1418939.1 PaaI family thioesterase [Nocardioides humilatus]